MDWLPTKNWEFPVSREALVLVFFFWLLGRPGKRDLFLIHDFLKAVIVISRDFVFENEHLSFSYFSLFEDGVGCLG